MPDKSKSETIKIPEAAKRLGIGTTLAYELAKRGELPACRKLGSRYIISVAELDWYLLGEAAKAAPPTNGNGNGHSGMVW